MPPPIPQEVCDRAKRLAAVHPLNVVAELIGVWPDTMTEMKKRGWKAAPGGRKRRARPADFAIQVRHMNQNQLRAHYRTSGMNITRWRREVDQ